MVVYILAFSLSILSALIPQEGHTQAVLLQGVVSDRFTGLPIPGAGFNLESPLPVVLDADLLPGPGVPL